MRWTGARGAAALGTWLAVLAAFVGPAWSQSSGLLALATPDAFADRPSTRLFMERDLDVPLRVEPELTIFTTSFIDHEPTDLRLVVTEGERWRLMEVGASLTLVELDAKITASGQLPHIVADVTPTAPDFDESQEPASLAVTGRIGGFEVGAQYRSVGKQLERLVKAPASYRDREGHEVWAAQRFGVLRLKLASSELTDNVDRNPALPRTTKDQTAVSAELGLDGWPLLGLTLASGQATRVRFTREGWDATPERHEFESVTGSIYYYGGPAWSVSASSTFSRSRPALGAGDDMTMAYHDLSLRLLPHESFTITPTLSFGQERYEPSGFGIDTSTAGLTLSYAPRGSRWSAWSYASYTTTRASDASTDVRNVSVTGALTYGLGRWLPGCTVSFQAGYDRYVDAAVPDSATQAVSGFVFLKLAGF